MCCAGEIRPRSSSALGVGARRRRSSTLPTTTATSRALLPKRATDSRLTPSTHACVFPRRTMSSNRRQPRPPHLSRISLHFGCISQTIAFSEASHDRPADVVIRESRCMDSLQSNVILSTGCGGWMYNLMHLFPTSFKPSGLANSCSAIRRLSRHGWSLPTLTVTSIKLLALDLGCLPGRPLDSLTSAAGCVWHPCRVDRHTVTDTGHTSLTLPCPGAQPWLLLNCGAGAPGESGPATGQVE